MKIMRDQRGQVLVLAALSMITLLGFVALAVDVGILFRAKRNAQIAADAAAIAGALDYNYNTSVPSAKAAAQAAATANGVTNGTGGTVVTVSLPPADGPNTSCSGCVEVQITEPNPTIFMAMSGPRSVAVGARAVAGKGGPGPACLYTLGSTGITGSGTGGISVPSCNIDDNGGITLSGSQAISANQTNMKGSYTHSGTSSVTPAPVSFGGATDPLASLTQPTVPGTCSTLSSPYPNPVPTGCYNSIVTSGTVTLHLQSGLYIFKGITASGSLNIVGTGVTIYMPSGGITGSGNVGLNITAPTSGTYNGMALWISRTNSSGITLSGNSTTSFQGIIYAPDSNLTFSGTTPLTLTSDLIVNNMTFSGNTTIQNYTTVNSTTPLGSGGGSANATFALVE